MDRHERFGPGTAGSGGARSGSDRVPSPITEAAGADGITVNTDQSVFMGLDTDLVIATAACRGPSLGKSFNPWTGSYSLCRCPGQAAGRGFWYFNCRDPRQAPLRDVLQCPLARRPGAVVHHWRGSPSTWRRQPSGRCQNSHRSDGLTSGPDGGRGL